MLLESWQNARPGVEPEFESLAAEYRLMPDGAIDVLNEAAYETCGEPVIDGDEDLTVNPYATEAMLA